MLPGEAGVVAIAFNEAQMKAFSMYFM